MKQKLISELLRESDFQKLQHYVILRNDTSKTEFLDFKQVQLIKFEERSIVLRLPQALCQVGHSLTLFLFSEPPKSNLKMTTKNAKFLKTIEIVGKVTDLNSSLPKQSEVVIQCTQYQKEEWYEIVTSYLERQRNINKLLSGHKVKLGA